MCCTHLFPRVLQHTSVVAGSTKCEDHDCCEPLVQKETEDVTVLY